MKRLILPLLAIAVAASAALAASDTPGAPAIQRNGYYFNQASGINRTNSSGATLTDDAARDRDSYLTPTQIMGPTRIAAGGADTTSIVDLSVYRTVALLVQCSFSSAADADSMIWQRYAVQARYNFGGAADSLSLFSMPVVSSDSSGFATGGIWRGQTPQANTLAMDEFPVTIVNTKASAKQAVANSLPNGRVFWLTLPAGFSWPSRCSFRFRNIQRNKAPGSQPTVTVWVMGTPL